MLDAHQRRFSGLEQQGLSPRMHEVLHLRGFAARDLLHLPRQTHLREGLQAAGRQVLPMRGMPHGHLLRTQWQDLLRGLQVQWSPDLMNWSGPSQLFVKPRDSLNRA